MAAMQEGLAVLPRELSGLMQLVHLDGIWCLRLGEAANEAALHPVLASVQASYPQAALVLGQVGRGRVAARVSSRPPAEAPVPPTPAPAAAVASGAAPTGTPTAAQVAAAPSVLAEPAVGEVQGAVPSVAEARPLPQITLASHTGPLAGLALPPQAIPDAAPAKASERPEAATDTAAGLGAAPAGESGPAAGGFSPWAALAAAAGLFLAASWLWLRRRVRPRAAAATARTGLGGPKTLFAVPGLAEDAELRLQDSLGELALVQANLLNVYSDRPVKSIYVTSCYNGEGKTTCAIALAHGLSCNKARVLLIDGNPRAAALAERYHTAASPGLCEGLQASTAPADLPRATRYPNLFLLPFGASPGSGLPDLLGGKRLEGLLSRYAELFDYIIMDGHSVGGADTNAVAGMFDGVLIAVQSGRTKWEVLKQASQRMTLVGATMLGVALNRRRFSASSSLCQSS
ncbi:Tyrosine-protein kinase EpsD [Desulfovibrio sp. DV]|nr:Tyrosine-protein kinase EpsD [Desulfovibrio sp. DV]